MVSEFASMLSFAVANVSCEVLRGDIARLERCTAITTGGDLPPELDDAEEQDPKSLEGPLPRTIKRSKPFKYTYEKEIVMYAYFKVCRPFRCKSIRR